VLIDILPAGVRQPLYIVYAVLGIVLGSIDIATDAIWVASALSIYAYVGAAVGLVAAANTIPVGAHAAPGPGHVTSRPAEDDLRDALLDVLTSSALARLVIDPATGEPYIDPTELAVSVAHELRHAGPSWLPGTVSPRVDPF